MVAIDDRHSCKIISFLNYGVFVGPPTDSSASGKKSSRKKAQPVSRPVSPEFYSPVAIERSSITFGPSSPQQAVLPTGWANTSPSDLVARSPQDVQFPLQESPVSVRTPRLRAPSIRAPSPSMHTLSPPTRASSILAPSVRSFSPELVEKTPRAWSPPPEQPDKELSNSTSHADASYQSALADYTKNRRELLDIIKELHSTGIQNELDLPQIVVVGSQSVGKSSLIESMSGISLPRDTGTCTRCPMECRLQSASKWSCKIVLRFQYDSAGSQLPEVCEVTFGSILYDKGEVEQALRRAQRAILRPTLDPSVFLDDSDKDVLGHPAQTFSANCVCIRVAGPSVPDLFFYDLPGIITNVGDGGNEADMTLIENLAKSYISHPNCIILLVISCETDFENQKAGALVLRNARFRQRTIGVLTKVDRIEDGAGASTRWLKILRGEDSTLPNGWFCVKQPDLLQRQAGLSWEDARASEKKFFNSKSPWSDLDRACRQRLGSELLSDRLGTLLSELVSRELPFIQRKILQQLHSVNDDLLDIPAPDVEDPRKEVITILRDFSKTLTKHIDGLPPTLRDEVHSLDNLPNVATPGLINRLHDLYEDFRSEVHDTAPQFRPWSSQQAIKESVERDMMASLQKIDETASSNAALRAFYLDEVMELVKKSRSRELPGNYPFSVKENLIRHSTRRWESLATTCFEDVRDMVVDYLKDLIEKQFSRYSHGGLKDAVRAVTVSVVEERARETARRLRALQTSEETPYTQNEHYFFDYQAKLLRRYKMVNGLLSKHANLVKTLQDYPVTQPGDSPSTRDGWINTIIANLANLGLHGIVAQDLAKLLPDDNTTTGMEIMAEVRAYFQVAYKRFADNVPKQIDTDFIRGTDSEVDFALRTLDLSHEQCLEWLQEPAEITNKRKDLIGKKKRLESAKERLADYYRSQEAGRRPDLQGERSRW